MSILKRIILTLVIIGAVNWGLIGLFQFDLVAAIFGSQMAPLSRVVYTLVGISGLLTIAMLFSPMGEEDGSEANTLRSEKINYGTEFGEEKDFNNENE